MKIKLKTEEIEVKLEEANDVSDNDKSLQNVPLR
jgi:hypothetical protein